MWHNQKTNVPAELVWWHLRTAVRVYECVCVLIYIALVHFEKDDAAYFKIVTHPYRQTHTEGHTNPSLTNILRTFLPIISDPYLGWGLCRVGDIAIPTEKILGMREYRGDGKIDFCKLNFPIC